ncbi:MAG: hypothetical protein M3Y60_13610 [Bacteroidota bacterium]|nr:hypothetical protein [Bacteroidota bacterium]
MEFELRCKLTSKELQQRRSTVIAELRKLVRTKEETQDGFRFGFESNDEILDTLIDFIKSERLCCEFFSFRLAISGDNAHLEITGPSGSKEFLEQEVGL